MRTMLRAAETRIGLPVSRVEANMAVVVTTFMNGLAMA